MTTKTTEERVDERVAIYARGYVGILPQESINRSAEWWRSELLEFANELEAEKQKAVEEERERIYRHIVSEEAINAPYDTDWKQGYLAGIDDVAKFIKT